MSTDLLKIILAGVGDTVRARAMLAPVCQAFASVIREQTSVTVLAVILRVRSMAANGVPARIQLSSTSHT